MATAELHTALADLEAQLAMGQPGQVRLGEDGELIIPPLTAEDVPSEAEALRGELSAILPRVPLASGLLSGKFRTDTVFPKDDIRQNFLTPRRLEEVIQRVDEVKSIIGSPRRA